MYSGLVVKGGAEHLSLVTPAYNGLCQEPKLRSTVCRLLVSLAMMSHKLSTLIIHYMNEL